MSVAGYTSTGSKRPAVLFGSSDIVVPRMIRAKGCTVTDRDGRSYVDFIMGLGAVALGYGHDAVNRAASDALARGTVGPLAPEDEAELADQLQRIMPWFEQVRFLKSGAEAVAAAVRIARAATRRDRVIGCGYHGWLDWCSDAPGVPAAMRSLYSTIPFNDSQVAIDAIRSAASELACVVVEPVIESLPDPEWLGVLRAETARAGALLVFDEIKTAFRIALGGATERWRVEPDLMVIGKALANGFPLAAVGGRRATMDSLGRTWISSTLATEFVSLAAAKATIDVMAAESVPARLTVLGTRLFEGLQRLAATHSRLSITAIGIPEMCYLRHNDESISARVTAACAADGLLFKRSAYNFVSLGHDEAIIDRALITLDNALAAC